MSITVSYLHSRKYTYADTDDGFWRPRELNPRGGKTVAIQVIQNWLLDELNIGDKLVRKVGIARCSEEDNYSKKIGRQIADSRLKETIITLIDKAKIGEKTIAFFQDQDSNIFEFHKTREYGYARFVRLVNE